MSDAGEWLPPKAACREVGRSGSYAAVYRALRDGRLAARPGARGQLVRLDDVRALLGGQGGGRGAGSGSGAPVRTGARTDRAPRYTAPRAPAVAPPVAAIAQEIELRSMRRTLDALRDDDLERIEARERARAAAEEARSDERHRWQRQEWTRGWRAWGRTRAHEMLGHLRDPPDIGSLRGIIDGAVDGALARAWPVTEVAPPGDDATARRLDEALVEALAPVAIAHMRAAHERQERRTAALAREAEKANEELAAQQMALWLALLQRRRDEERERDEQRARMMVVMMMMMSTPPMLLPPR